MHQLDRLTAERATLGARRAELAGRLSGLRAELASARLRQRLDQLNLSASRQRLAQALVTQYKSGNGDAAAFLLASGSFSDMVDRIEALDRVGSEERLALSQLGADSALMRSDIATVSRRETAVSAELAQLNADRARLDASIAQRQAVLASINQRIRSQIASEVQRRHRLAQRDGGPTSPAPTPTPTGSPPPPSNVFYGDVTWYGPGFAGKRTASGEIFDPHKLTAASPWLAFGTMLRVTDEATGESVTVRVNDRGPFGQGVLDLSQHAAQVIGLTGWQRCRIAVL
jgi:rare lipoprotein A